MQHPMKAERNWDVIMGVCLDVKVVAGNRVLMAALTIVPVVVLVRAKVAAHTLVVIVAMEVVEIGNTLYIGFKNYAETVA